MVTLLEFESKHGAPARSVVNSFVRHELESEGRSLQARYDSRQIKRRARDDVFAATDFDGSIADQLGLSADARTFQIFVLGRKGELLRRWLAVPTADELDAALKSAAQ